MTNFQVWVDATWTELFAAPNRERMNKQGYEERTAQLGERIDEIIDRSGIQGWDESGRESKLSIPIDIIDFSLKANGIDADTISNDRQLEEQLRRVYTGKRILDLGSRHGGLYHPLLKFLGGEVIGIEREKEMVDLGTRKGANIVQTDVRELAGISRTFPIIFANELYCQKYLQEKTFDGPEFSQAIERIERGGFFLATGTDLYLNRTIFEKFYTGRKRGLQIEHRWRRYTTADLERKQRDAGATIDTLFSAFIPQQAFFVKKEKN